MSSAEVADLLDITQNSAGKLLTKLEHDGYLEPGRENRRGRGFFFRPVAD